MRIVVNHLTRMRGGYICGAGIDMESLGHVRPIPSGGRLSTECLCRHGGNFDMAVLLDLDTPLSLSRRPQIEDKIVDVSEIQLVGTLRPRKFWSLLTQIAKPKLKEIFGHDLVKIGSKSCGVEVGKGEASLGCLIPDSRPTLYIRGRSDRPDQVRMGLSDGAFFLDCGVTDIRLYGDDHITPHESVVEGVGRRLKEGVDVILSMGLTRAYASSGEFEPVHWLQVNNIHLADDPGWQLK